MLKEGKLHSVAKGIAALVHVGTRQGAISVGLRHIKKLTSPPRASSSLEGSL